MKLKLHFAILSALLALSAACGGHKGDGQAFLTIIGDRNVFLDNGEVQKLRVRYHDAEDRPLQGAVDFRLVGSTAGSTLSKTTAVTNADGIVEIDIRGGQSGSANFSVTAEANYASEARWTVQVGGVPDLNPVGRYELKSKLDIISGLDNTAGDVINTFIDMTDNKCSWSKTQENCHDPASWIIDQGIKKLQDQGGFWEDAANVLQVFRSTIDEKANDWLMENAPEFVNDILEIGEAIGDVTRNFGTISILDVDGRGNSAEVDDRGYDATHTLTGVYFDIRGTEYAYSMESIGGEPITAEDITVSKDAKNMFVISKHPMPLTYGNAIIIVLEEAIIPLVDDNADDLGDFLQNRVDCAQFGDKVEEGVDIPSGIGEGLCEFGLEATAALVKDQLLKLDEAGISVNIEGVSRPRDTNGDGKVDALQAGKWSGEIDYVGTEATLDPDDNTFTGVRIGNSTR